MITTATPALASTARCLAAALDPFAVAEQSGVSGVTIADVMVMVFYSTDTGHGELTHAPAPYILHLSGADARRLLAGSGAAPQTAK